VEKFLRWETSLDAVPVIVALRQRAEEIKFEEMKRLFNRLGDIDERQRRLIETSFTAVVNRLIHPPTVALKEDAEARDSLIALIRRLYGINGDEEE